MGKLLNDCRRICNVQVMGGFINLLIHFTLISWDIYLFTADYFYDALLVYELNMYVKDGGCFA